MINRLFLFITGIFLFPAVNSQNWISFLEEYIDFNLDSIYFSVNGIYTFKNNTSSRIDQAIMYPFPANTNQIDSISVSNLNNSKRVPFEKKGKEIIFKIQVLPFDTLDINIYYRQKSSIRNTYILTTTNYWKESLKKANYSLTTNRNLKIKSFSYQPDSVIQRDKNNIYLWYNYNFMPQKDFEIIIDK